MRFTVRLQPRASRNEIAGWYGDSLKVRVTAAPVDNAANEALIRLIADALAVRRDSIRILAGHSSRTKLIEIRDASADSVRRLAASPHTDKPK